MTAMSDDSNPDDGLDPIEFEREFNTSFDADELEKELLAMMDDEPTSPKESCRALVLSPIDAPGALRAALNLVGSPAPVVGLGGATGVFLEIATDGGDPQEAEMMALLGEERPLPREVDQMARLLSKLTAHGAVAVAAWITKNTAEGGEEGDLSGTIVARRYVNGEPEAALSSGLVLSGLSLGAEELLLGRMTPEEADDHRNGGPWTGWLKGRGKR